jgi:lactate permease
VDPVVTVSANASGGVTGKMISPQSIAIGAAAVGLVGKESELFRFTVKHSFIMLLVVCILTMMQAYWITWVIPTYEMLVTAPTVAAADISKGLIYLLILACVLALIALAVLFLTRKKSKQAVTPQYTKI